MGGGSIRGGFVEYGPILIKIITIEREYGMRGRRNRSAACDEARLEALGSLLTEGNCPPC